MNDLNSQQIVLLTLLVSFVTSIATGITTVSLLEKAPEPVTQTINRVVEKTVERIVEVDPETNEPQEKIVETVIVKEEDLTIEAVEKNSKSLVRIFEKTGDLKTFVGIGIIVSGDGSVLAPSEIIRDNYQYFASYPNSNEFEIKVSTTSEEFTLLDISSEQKPNDFSKVVIGNSQNLKLGQSVIALSGETSNIVSTGIVTSIETLNKTLTDTEVNATTTPSEQFTIINTSVNSDKMVKGAILLNLQGELVGYKAESLIPLTSFNPSSQIRSFLDYLNQSN